MTNPPTHTYPFDTRPLTDPVDPRAVSEFWRSIRSRYPASASTIVAWVIIGVVAIMILVPMFGITVIGIIAGGSGIGPAGGVFSIPFLIMLVALGAGVPIGIVSMRRKRAEAFRIAQFAAANGMAYEHQVNQPALPGMIFGNGSSRVASSLVRGYSPRFVEFGNYRYTTGSGKNQTTHHWGYVAVKLDVPLPNIVLDALGNNALGSNLPATFSRDQRLSLEGDFDRYFSLYCPRGYEADALYLLPPDIMQSLLTHARALDVELSGSTVRLYAPQGIITTDGDSWRGLLETVESIRDMARQWAQWRDDRLMPEDAVGSSPGARPLGVARQGRRLRSRFPWFAFVFGLVGLIVWLISVISEAAEGIAGWMGG